MKKIALFFFVFLSISCFSQFSKTHYIPPLTAQNNLAEDQYLYISTPNTNYVKVKIIEIGGAIIKDSVKNSTPLRHDIFGVGNNTQLFTPKTKIGKISNKGYIIEAEDLVYVSVRVNASRNPDDGTYNHAGGLVSKGNSALGTIFRLGAMLNPLYDTSLLNFASVLATENNTKVTISNIPLGTPFSDGTTFTGPITVILDKDESYVLALENSDDGNPTSNSSKMIGALVESDKPVAVNSGSFGGSNSSLLIRDRFGVLGPAGRDLGFDQIVDFEKTGIEYIFVKGLGTDEIERVLLIAHNPNTIVNLNGSTTPFGAPLNAGDFIAIDGSQFIDGNLYVTTSEKVFAYQSIGGLAPGFLPDGRPNSPPANQNLFFVPPLNCSTPNTVDNIPLIQSIGSTNFNGGLNIVTEVDALVKINGAPITAVPVSLAANGKPNFVRYTINGLSGNVSVKSEKQVYVSYFGTNGAATYGGYYSGFDLKPEIVSDKINVSNSSCIPNIELKINTLSSYDVFQWYKNGNAIDPILYPDAITRGYKPDVPAYYKVKGSISACGTTISSDEIPVSYCPTDLDNDKANDNIDVDNDNDGILNCTESYGDKNIDVSTPTAGNVTIGSDYANPFTGEVIPIVTAATTHFIGSADGSFISEVPVGIGNSVTYKMKFDKKISLGIEYVNNPANPLNLLNSNAEYILKSDVDKTITVLDPGNQLLIDINYDGVYETIEKDKSFSSFEIRFRLNNATLPPGRTTLEAGTGTFKFLSNLTKTIQFTHKNLSDTDANKSTLKFFAVCVPKDSDGDLIPDQLDLDSDNDGIPDIIEAHGNSAVSLSNSDTDNNGLDNAFSLGFTPVDSDLDGIADYLDLDSDNDGILDIIETGIDTDVDGIKNYRDLDSDNDLCLDVIEYTAPIYDNYITYAPIEITVQPLVFPTCELQNASITLVDNGVNAYQWELSTDNGANWNDIANNPPYSDATTKTLSITSVTNAMDGYKYRVKLSKDGNSCGEISDGKAVLTVYPLPVVTPIEIIQCDDDLDLKTFFNLTVKNDFISSNSANETFTYYISLVGANTANFAELIDTPQAFQNINLPLPAIQGLMYVWARVSNKITGCFSTAKLTLKVAASKIPPAYRYDVTPVCDDTLAADGTSTGNPNTNKRDGISTFDLTDAIKDFESQLPPPLSNYTIKYYRNKAAALAQNDSTGNSLAIKPTEYTNFRNDKPLNQNIWVRVNNNLTSDCGDGFGDFIKLKVEELPFANPVPIFRQCDDDQDGIFGFDTSTLETDILQGQSNIDLTYFDDLGNQLSPLPNPLFVNKTKTIIVKMTNNPSLASDGPCYYEEKITFIVDELPKKFVILITDMTDVNTITVNVNESGNYEYSLDEPSGYFQDSNFFTDVPAGIHTVYINDKNGCGFVSKTIAVVGAPKFFTPNGDGYNDYWNVQGVNASFNTKSIIYIFDRYGKLLKQWVPASNESWDGTSNGAPLPADDYWYTLKLEDGRETKGNFSLKR